MNWFDILKNYPDPIHEIIDDFSSYFTKLYLWGEMVQTAIKKIKQRPAYFAELEEGIHLDEIKEYINELEIMRESNDIQALHELISMAEAINDSYNEIRDIVNSNQKSFLMVFRRNLNVPELPELPPIEKHKKTVRMFLQQVSETRFIQEGSRRRQS